MAFTLPIVPPARSMQCGIEFETFMMETDSGQLDVAAGIVRRMQAAKSQRHSIFSPTFCGQ
jgi:hypothetical protein